MFDAKKLSVPHLRFYPYVKSFPQGKRTVDFDYVGRLQDDANKATKWFEDNNIDVMVWPPQSLNINPIEHLWIELKKTLRKYSTPPKGVHELWDGVVVEWNAIH
jgi:hypothetical protein